MFVFQPSRQHNPVYVEYVTVSSFLQSNAQSSRYSQTCKAISTNRRKEPRNLIGSLATWTCQYFWSRNTSRTLQPAYLPHLKVGVFSLSRTVAHFARHFATMRLVDAKRLKIKAVVPRASQYENSTQLEPKWTWI